MLFPCRCNCRTAQDPRSFYSRNSVTLPFATFQMLSLVPAAATYESSQVPGAGQIRCLW